MALTVTPQGTIYLCRVDLREDQLNQIDFGKDDEARLNYFMSKTVRTFNDYTYVKANSSVTVQGHYDDLLTCDYMVYRNTGFTNTWRYCFITGKEYVNENATRLFIKSDVWQCWESRITVGKSFVVREHTNNDTRGNNLQKEPFAIGDFTCVKQIDSGIISTRTNNLIVVQLTQTEKSNVLFGNKDVQYTQVGKSYQVGINIVIYMNDENGQGVDGITKLKSLIKLLNAQQLTDTIVKIYLLPKTSIKTEWLEEITLQAPSNTYKFFKLKDVTRLDLVGNVSTEWVFPTNNLDGYVPKNKKLLTYPYCYLLVDNSGGTDIVYHYELFKNTKTVEGENGQTKEFCEFKFFKNPSINAPIYVTPENYQGIDDSVPNGFMCPNYPELGYSQDLATVSFARSLFHTTTQTVSNLGKSFINDRDIYGQMPLGKVANTALITATSLIHSAYDASLIPNTAEGNVNASDLMINFGYNHVRYYHMTILKEQAKKLDDYLTMFGYATNELKTPNLRGRRNWNYVQLINPIIYGSIPQEDMQELEAMFEHGLTLWHNPNTFLDYGQDNSII